MSIFLFASGWFCYTIFIVNFKMSYIYIFIVLFYSIIVGFINFELSKLLNKFFDTTFYYIIFCTGKRFIYFDLVLSSVYCSNNTIPFFLCFSKILFYIVLFIKLSSEITNHLSIYMCIPFFLKS